MQEDSRQKCGNLKINKKKKCIARFPRKIKLLRAYPVALYNIINDSLFNRLIIFIKMIVKIWTNFHSSFSTNGKLSFLQFLTVNIFQKQKDLAFS